MKRNETKWNEISVSQTETKNSSLKRDKRAILWSQRVEKFFYLPSKKLFTNRVNRANVRGKSTKVFLNNRIGWKHRSCLCIFATAPPLLQIKPEFKLRFTPSVTQRRIRACWRDNFRGTLSSRLATVSLYSTRDIYYAAVLPPLVCQMTLVFVANCNADDCGGIAVSETLPTRELCESAPISFAIKREFTARSLRRRNIRSCVLSCEISQLSAFYSKNARQD